MRLCIHEDIWLEDPLLEDDQALLKSLCVLSTKWEIKAQKIDLSPIDMEDVLDVIAYYTGGNIALQRYDSGRYTLSFYF